MIIDHLLRNKDKSKYDLSKELDKSYSLIHGYVQNLLEREVIVVSKIVRGERSNYKNVELYQLSNKAIWGLLVKHLSKDDIDYFYKVIDLFDMIKSNYPSFLPDEIRDLPLSYLAFFYRYLHGIPFKRNFTLSDAHKSINTIKILYDILEAKLENMALNEILIINGQIKHAIPVTVIELKMILKIIERLTERSTETIHQYSQIIQGQKSKLESFKKVLTN